MVSMSTALQHVDNITNLIVPIELLLQLID